MGIRLTLLDINTSMVVSLSENSLSPWKTETEAGAQGPQQSKDRVCHAETASQVRHCSECFVLTHPTPPNLGKVLNKERMPSMVCPLHASDVPRLCFIVFSNLLLQNRLLPSICLRSLLAHLTGTSVYSCEDRDQKGQKGVGRGSGR